MNTIGRILVVSGIAGLVAYVVSKRHYTNTQAEESENLEKEENKTQERSDSVDAKKGKSTTEYSNESTLKMYKNLEMTEDQKRRYERDYKVVMDKWEKDNPGVDMDEVERKKEHNSALKAVLNEAQYSKYRDWLKNDSVL